MRLNGIVDVPSFVRIKTQDFSCTTLLLFALREGAQVGVDRWLKQTETFTQETDVCVLNIDLPFLTFVT